MREGQLLERQNPWLLPLRVPTRNASQPVGIPTAVLAATEARTIETMALLYERNRIPYEGISILYAGIDRDAVRSEAGLTLLSRNLAGGA